MEIHPAYVTLIKNECVDYLVLVNGAPASTVTLSIHGSPSTGTIDESLRRYCATGCNQSSCQVTVDARVDADSAESVVFIVNTGWVSLSGSVESPPEYADGGRVFVSLHQKDDNGWASATTSIHRPGDFLLRGLDTEDLAEGKVRAFMDRNGNGVEDPFVDLVGETLLDWPSVMNPHVLLVAPEQPGSAPEAPEILIFRNPGGEAMVACLAGTPDAGGFDGGGHDGGGIDGGGDDGGGGDGGWGDGGGDGGFQQVRPSHFRIRWWEPGTTVDAGVLEVMAKNHYPVVVDGLNPSATYMFSCTAFTGDTPSHERTAFREAPHVDGGGTVEGMIDLQDFPSVHALVVAVYAMQETDDGPSDLWFTRIANPTTQGEQSYSINHIPFGDNYRFIAMLDVNEPFGVFELDPVLMDLDTIFSVQAHTTPVHLGTHTFYRAGAEAEITTNSEQSQTRDAGFVTRRFWTTHAVRPLLKPIARATLASWLGKRDPRDMGLSAWQDEVEYDLESPLDGGPASLGQEAQYEVTFVDRTAEVIHAYSSSPLAGTPFLTYPLGTLSRDSLPSELEFMWTLAEVPDGGSPPYLDVEFVIWERSNMQSLPEVCFTKVSGGPPLPTFSCPLYRFQNDTEYEWNVGIWDEVGNSSRTRAQFMITTQ